MKRMHVMLKVNELNESIEFYKTLFGSDPTVQKEDYAKWMLDNTRVRKASNTWAFRPRARRSLRTCEPRSVPPMAWRGKKARRPVAEALDVLERHDFEYPNHPFFYLS